MLVEVWSDVVCPWCHVGLARFEAAVERLGWDGDVDVVLRAFELPMRPTPSGPRNTAVAARLEAAGAELGLTFDWRRVRRAPTFDAHRLAAWALATAGARQQVSLERRVMHAFFAEGLDPSDHAALVELAGDVGLDVAAAAQVLASSAFGDEVRAAEAEAEQLDIYGVPAFRFERALVIPGAQDVDTFVSLLTRVRERISSR